MRSRLLVRHEQVMDRLRSEVLSVMGDGEHPTREQIRRMPYLASVIKESMRAPSARRLHMLTVDA